MLHELRHPHVVNMFRVIPLGWPSPDSKALDLEFCGDGDVTTAPLSTAEILTCFEQVLSALLFCHSQGTRVITLKVTTPTLGMVQLWISRFPRPPRFTGFFCFMGLHFPTAVQLLLLKQAFCTGT